MGRVIKPAEIKVQVNGVVSALTSDEALLQEALTETTAFAQVSDLYGNAWNGVKEQIGSHDTVIRGLVCMIDAMTEASKNLVSLSGDENLDEDVLLEQIKQLNEDKASHQKAIEIYKGWLKDPLYAAILGSHARMMVTSYQSAIDSLDDKIKLAEEKLDTIDDIDEATKDLTSEVTTLYNATSQGISYLESTWTGSGFTVGDDLQNLSWMSVINDAWKQSIEKKEAERLALLKQYYDALPEELKAHISIDDLMVTDDGFFLCTKPMDEILNSMGLNNQIELIAGVPVEMYDDWHLAGVMDVNGEMTYTLVKVREPGDSQGATGTAVPFIALDITSLTNIAGKSGSKEKISKSDKEELYNSFYSVTNGKGKSDDTLVSYFKKTASKGSYVIADFTIEKTKRDFDDNGVYQMQVSYDTHDEHSRARLDELSKAGVYDKEKNTITVKDINNLTKAEEDAIIVAVTGNPDKYAYAGENQYHAKNVDGPFHSHAIVSDARPGESASGGFYEWNFKKRDGEDNNLYAKQKKAHDTKK